MFRIRSNPTSALRYITFCVLLLCFVAAVFTQDAQQSLNPLQKLQEWATLLVVLAAAGTIIFNVIWSFFNRKQYDKLNETIKDLTESLKAKEERIVNLKLTCSESEARLGLEIKGHEVSNETLKVSNKALVSQNLQMVAILKKLRLANLWEGHEEEIHGSK